MSVFAQQMKARRIQEGLSLRDLEKLTGVSFSTLARVERDKGTCTKAVRQAIAAWVYHGKETAKREKKVTSWHMTIEQRLQRIEAALGLSAPERRDGDE